MSMKKQLSPKQRINRIMDFYHKRGQNRELANEVYRKIIAIKFAQ